MTTYYVSKSGNNNNPGTQSSPWLTIQKAASSIAPGDTVLIQRGTYNEIVTINTSGLSNSARTIFSSYPGDERLVVIDGTSLHPPRGLVDIQASYITFQNIKVQNVPIGQPGTGIYAGDSTTPSGTPTVHRNDITIFNCYTYNTSGYGIEVANCSSLLLDSNEIELAANGNWTECFDLYYCNGFEIRNTYLHDCASGQNGNGGEGMMIDQCQNGKIHHNTVTNIQKAPIFLTCWWPTATTTNCENIDIYSNICHDMPNGQQILITTENQTAITRNINIYNNVLYDSTRSGLGFVQIDGGWANNGLANIYITNNTLGNGGFWINGPYLTNIIFRNNVCTMINTDSPGKITKSNNWEMNYQGSSGLFVNPAGHDYHLTSNSHLIDIGTSNGAPLFDFDGNIRPQGAGFDIGAYEYVSTTPTLSATLSINPNAVTLGQSVTFTTTVSGGQPPYNYSYSGLPSPCSGNTNSITCTPNTVGTYNVSVKVTDANNISASSIGTLIVNPQTTTSPIFIQEAETAWNNSNSPKTTPSFNAKKGDILVAYCMMENYGTLTISGGSLTWILRQSVLTANYAPVYVWTATVDVDKTMSVIFSTSSRLFFGGNVLTFRNSSGIGNSSKTNVSSGAPILNITTTKANSAIVVANCDWIALDGSSRIWRTTAGTFNEKSYFRDSARYTVYGGYHPNAGAIGTYAVGLSSPSGQKYSIVAVEIKG